jgi:hypothetical protein
MSNATVKSTVYCLNYTPELGMQYGTTPYLERHGQLDSSFINDLPGFVQTYDEAARYAPNMAYIGAITLEQLGSQRRPWHANLLETPTRFGKYGEIMPEDEFLGLMDICDVFDLIWLEEQFARVVREKLSAHPVLSDNIVKRLKAGREESVIHNEIKKNRALPLFFGGKVIGCCRRGHEIDESLTSHIMLENIASKTGGLLALLHLLKKADMRPGDIDFVVECSEEAAGDMNQRGGGNFAKAIAEIAGCTNASGLDIRAFCAAPVDALITAASMVASGSRQNVVVLAGGALPKLFMNARDHVKNKMPALENCLGNFAVLLTPDDGKSPVIRLDALGKHSIGAGASPQSVTNSLVFEPLQKAGLQFADVDKYAAELQIPEITVPAGGGDVPEANFKMIAALAVLKGQLERSAINDFVAKHGIPGFAHTQGHIPSGVPFLGHAVDAIASGKMKRCMIIGKGSLFLARLTGLSDGASFIVEASSGKQASGLTQDEIKVILLDVLDDLADSLKKKYKDIV